MCVALLAFVLATSTAAHGDTRIGGNVGVSTTGGFARLTFSFTDEVEAEVRVTNGIAIIGFRKPVEISVERLADEAPGYISAARRDPDGMAVRIALARKVTVNTMAAGERLFVDLLPETWSGLPPGLPQEVIEELARRAREAEKRARQAELMARQRARPPLRVRVARQPTFTRFIFNLPEPVAVTSERGRDSLALRFEAPLRFDLSETKTGLPPWVIGLHAETGADAATVRFQFAGSADVRTFREDSSFVVDVTPVETQAPALEGNQSGALPGAAETAPALAERSPSTAPENRGRTVEHVHPRPSSDAFPPRPAVATARESEQNPTPGDHDKTRIPVQLRGKGETLKLVLPFARPTAAAIFCRFDTLWLVFDTERAIDVGSLLEEAGRTIRSVDVSRSPGAQILRVRLDRIRLVSAELEDANWVVTIGDEAVASAAPLALMRTSPAAGRMSALIPLEGVGKIHRLSDPEIGDELIVATALPPVRGFIRTHDLVEFRVLSSVHGLAVQPFVDDLDAEGAADKIVLSRPVGLTLSATSASRRAESNAQGMQSMLFDPQRWGFERAAAFQERKNRLINMAASASPARRTVARLELARFYLGRDMFAEAKAVLDVALADDRRRDDPSGLLLRAVANILMERGSEALSDLAGPPVVNNQDAVLWRALALASERRWTEASAAFRAADGAIGLLPVELQRFALMRAARAAIEAGDLAEAERYLNELEVVSVPPEHRPGLAVLSGRIAERHGRSGEAFAAYGSAAASRHPAAAAEGQLREILLRIALRQIGRNDAIAALEALAVRWRGDEIEMQALEQLAKFYKEEARYRDSLAVARTAVSIRPGSPLARRIQEAAAATFESLFLSGEEENLSPIEALGLFYDFRELIPNGRRGDEMIRRLVDRLVAVDLLDQAAELMQHQVDHRLQGAARAQAAARLAVIYLMNRKPGRALAVLQATRSPELNNALRRERLLLEARALSETGRHDVALEVVANLAGPDVERLRADILWAARRWQEAGEQLEKVLGDRWRASAPLTEWERADILRAAVAFVLAEDRIGIDRLRERYAARMAEGPDAQAFAVVTVPMPAESPELRSVTEAVLSSSTLERFLRELRARHPDSGTASPPPQGSAAARVTSR